MMTNDARAVFSAQQAHLDRTVEGMKKFAFFEDSLMSDEKGLQRTCHEKSRE